MPSESVYSHSGDIDTRVSWGKWPQGTVQVATLVRKTTEFDPTQRIIKIVNQWLKAAEMPTIDFDELKKKMPEELRGVEPFFDGYCATYDDWASVNYLIKTLKKARDDAFGRPE
jgi:hypothetical protein